MGYRMKIIARTGNTAFLVEMSHNELNDVSGHDLRIDSYCVSPFKINQEITIQKNWTYLKGIFDKKNELIRSATNLRSMADMIESISVPEIIDDELKL